MLKIYRKFAFLSIVSILFFFVNNCFSQNRFNEEISQELSAFVEKRKQFIISEVAKTPKDEWSGIYSRSLGTTISFTLIWSLNNGFVTSYFNCSRPWTERVNYGKAEFKDNSLKIYPELTEDKPNAYRFEPNNTILIPVKWGEQHFLIPSDKLANFAYAANYESEIDSFLSKSDDYNKPRTGLPNLPEQYRHYLTKRPIKAKIIKLSETPNNSQQNITLNVGHSDGVRPEMYFYSSGLKDIYVKVYIHSVQENTSEASIAFIAGDTGEEIKPKIGWSFTSKLPKSGFYSP